MTHDNQLRTGLRTALLANGVPAAHVDEVVDLSIHAAAKAMAAVMDVIRTASDDRIGLCLIGVASSILRAKLDDLETAQREFAAEKGLPVRQAHVSVAA